MSQGHVAAAIVSRAVAVNSLGLIAGMAVGVIGIMAS
jgi:hypothetical protein